MKYCIVSVEQDIYHFFKGLKSGSLLKKITTRLSKSLSEVGYEITRATQAFGGMVGASAITHGSTLSGVGCYVLLYRTIHSTD
jgi:hypothetical protein